MDRRIIGTCPFCGYRDYTEAAIVLHIEVRHPNGHATAEDEAELRLGRQGRYQEIAKCTWKDCGDEVRLADFAAHIAQHENSENGTVKTNQEGDGGASGTVDVWDSGSERLPGETEVSPDDWKSLLEPPTSTTDPSPRDNMPILKLIKVTNSPPKFVLSPPKTEGGKKKEVTKAPEDSEDPDDPDDPDDPESPKYQYTPPKLSIAEMYEQEGPMPRRIRATLERSKYRISRGTIPHLARRLERSGTTAWAFLCHPGTDHIHKNLREGSFCGYRSGQTVMSYILNTRAPGHDNLRRRYGDEPPNVFQYQDLIHEAWDNNIARHAGSTLNYHVRGTRKYIGTSEISAVHHLLGFVRDFSLFETDNNTSATTKLLDAVEKYFRGIPQADELFDEPPEEKVNPTQRAPIYLQLPGHAVVIVGIERGVDTPATKGSRGRGRKARPAQRGARNLLVFDPAKAEPRFLRTSTTSPATIEAIVSSYRSDVLRLEKYSMFELVWLEKVHDYTP